jgi:hypothetical protein
VAPGLEIVYGRGLNGGRGIVEVITCDKCQGQWFLRAE